MARCPHCQQILDDAWLRREGAAAMGKAGGKSKRRANAKEAIMTRWMKEKERKNQT